MKYDYENELICLKNKVFAYEADFEQNKANVVNTENEKKALQQTIEMLQSKVKDSIKDQNKIETLEIELSNANAIIKVSL